MTYRQRILFEMAKKVAIFFAGCAAYVALALAVGYALWGLFGISPDIAIQIGLTGPVLLVAAAMLLFIVWEHSKDKVDEEDRKIMRALGQSHRFREDE